MFYIFLTLIFIRPFISGPAFPCLNSVYTYLLLAFLLIWGLARGLPLARIRPLTYPLIPFLACLLISTVFSIDKAASIRELFNYGAFLLLFLLGACLTNVEINRIIRALLLAGVIIGLLAVYQYLFGFRRLLDYIAENRINYPFALDYIERQRAFFPFVTPNALAGYLILIIPLCLIREGRKKWLILAPLLCALFLTKSLGAILSLFLGTAFYLYLRKGLSGRQLLLLGALAGAFFAVFALRQAVTAEHTRPAFSLSQRLDYWQDTLKIIKARLLTGAGPGNFSASSSRYAHNSWLQIWAETGICGLIAFAWMNLSILKSKLKFLKTGPPDGRAAALLASCVIFLIHNLMEFTFFLPEVSSLWWLIAGLLF